MDLVKKIFTLSIPLLMGLSACQTPARVVVVHRPHPPVVARPLPPHPGWVWIEGDWIWRGRHYVWKPGYWRAPRPGYAWIPGHWRRVPHGWHWEAGHWG
jgi:hypothetical protein